ncbi:expressed unknown protein [Seminavis robusta]|uniref:Methyltransferase domain-containing protein n=1 Tax=Seminavis robusta TaxID=568900 RepID=A0A9N8HAQ6_9STRA|nr:expressed unknown protein [Seminavis robusta]|eukprot:Sro156_g070960.1 n/a (452) ;mRNA; r:93217-94572
MVQIQTPPRNGGTGVNIGGTTYNVPADKQTVERVGIFVCGMFVFWILSRVTDTSGVVEFSLPMGSMGSTNTAMAKTGGELRPYCAGTTDYFEETALENAIAQARLFHTQGGSLKSVQNLLDKHIDTTVKKLGATFIPNGMTEKQGTQDVTQFLKSYFAQNYDPRGGYGSPLPGEYEPKNHPLIHAGRYVEVADPVDSIERWDASLGPTFPCPNLLRLGKKGADGTKWYCQPMEHAQNSNSNNKNNNNDCHIISIGGNDNWKFEMEVVTTMPGCTTHTFDCTLQNGTPQWKPERDDIKFYNYCIDSVDRKDGHGRHYITYFDMVQKAQLRAPPKMLKIDVEGFEFDVFSSMMQQANSNEEMAITATTTKSDGTRGRVHHHPPSYWLPQQIMVELHWATRMTGVSWMPRTRTAAEIALLSNVMYTGGGYMPIFLFWIKRCPSCMEVLYFRTLC